MSINHSEVNLPVELDFQPVKSTQSSRAQGEAGAISIVKTDKHGKRISLAEAVLNHLDIPDQVQIAISSKGLVIGTNLPGKHNRFAVRTSGKRGVIYAAQLVDELADHYQLNFDQRTSISFTDVQYIEKSENCGAYVIVPLHQ